MRLVLALSLTISTAACSTARGAAEPMVRVRAGADLDCPDADLRLEEELGGRYKVIGCGRKAYYRTACEGLRCDVRAEDEPSIPWKDRPEPGDPTAR